MNPNQPNQQFDPYASPYSPAPEPAQPVPNPDMFQPSLQSYGSQNSSYSQPTSQSPFGVAGAYEAPTGMPSPAPNVPQPPYGTAPQFPSSPNSNAARYTQYGRPMGPQTGMAQQPGMMQQAPIPQVQSPMMGYNPYPYPGEFETPKRRPNKLILGIIAVVVMVGAVFVVLALSSSNNTATQTNQDTTDQNSTVSENTGKDVTARSDNKLDLSSKINVNSSLKQQSVQASMNEQINLSSGFSFMAISVSPYTPSNNTTTPTAGKRFIVATVVVGNRAESGNLSVSYLDFRLRGSNDTLITPHAATNEIVNNQLANPTELKPGEQLTGKIVFEVGDKESTWALQHSETYQKTTDNTTFDVKGEVGLVLIGTGSNSNSSTTP